MTEKDLELQQLRREVDELRAKYEHERLCYVSEMCEHERLKAEAEELRARIVASRDVSDLGLPAYLWHALKREGVNTLDDLRRVAAQRCSVPGIGVRGWAVIDKALEHFKEEG